MVKQNPELLGALNHALAEEMAAIVQYMWHHVMVKGMESPELMEKFRQTSMEEMKHAEMLAERIDYLGGTPTTAVGPIQMGGDAHQMVVDDLAAEERAIKMYREYVDLAQRLGDVVTRHILEEILEDEEEHAHLWETVLGR